MVETIAMDGDYASPGAPSLRQYQYQRVRALAAGRRAPAGRKHEVVKDDL
ncbi:MAG TPA: hypothetical protein VMW48_18785 [Vicinamibacterales bacterium]|nr:hypothetical protein [Vicinamibacterales bacterium]